MNVPSIETDNTASTIIDDDMSMTVNDSSETTVATQTSSSWHSVVSDVQINHNLFLRSSSINTWLKICSIEPDIRLTTAQEWKLRMCLRRLLSLCDLPLKISWTKGEESIAYIDQIDSTLIDPRLDNRLEQLGLYLHISSTIDGLLEVKLFEFYAAKSENRTMIPLSLLKSPRFVFHLSLNFLQLSLRSANSLLQLHFSTREQEPIGGNYYKWNEEKHEQLQYKVTADIDQSLINELKTIEFAD